MPPPASCVNEASCGAGSGLACVRGECVPCRAHGECESQVCDPSQDVSGDRPGRCLPRESLVYANNQGGACTGMHQGTQADPVCNVTEARARLGGEKIAIRLAPSGASYGTILIDSGMVSIYGPAGEGGEAQLGGDLNQDAIVVTGGGLKLDGVRVKGKTGLRCVGSMTTVEIRRSQVLDTSGVGMDVQGCSLMMDRVVIRGSKDGALAMGTGASYSVSNSFLVANSSLANATIRISNNSKGTFRFNTVAGNVSSVAAGISCGQISRTLEASIFAGNTAVGGSQIAGACTLLDTVVGAMDAAPGIRKDPEFVAPMAPMSDYRLKDTPGNAACCVDQIPAERVAAPKVRVDHDGTPRPQRLRLDVGAHELR